MKIAAIVFNSVLHDARVIKEAESLKKSGYDVRIFGVYDNNCTSSEAVTSGGVPVTLVKWRHLLNRDRSLVELPLLALVLLVGGSLGSQSAYAVECLYFVLCAGIFLGFLVFRYKFFRGRRMRGKVIGANLPSTLTKKIRTWLRSQFQDSVTVRFVYLLSRFKVFSTAICDELQGFEPDVIHCHDLHALPVGLKMKESMGVKVVYDSHEIYTELSNNFLLKKLYYRWFEKRSSAKIDAFITVNDSIASLLKKRNPLLPAPVVVKNATLFDGEIVSYDGRLHRAAEIGQERKILLYQGGYAKYRGLEALVRASVLLPHDWCVVFMGWGKIEDDLKMLAEQLDPNGKSVRFVPPAPHKDLALWSAGASLGIIPYENVSLNHYYCSPNKLWEYPVAGVPILASPFPELKAVIEEHNIGWFFDDPLTPESIVEVVYEITDEDLLLKKNACRNFIRSDNWSHYESRLIRLYEQLAIKD